MSNFSKCIALLKKRGHILGIGAKEGFAEIVQRHEGRYEMRYCMHEGGFHNILEKLHPKIRKVSTSA